jgi:hypothetical protein
MIESSVSKLYIYQGTADPGSSLTVEQRKSKKNDQVTARKSQATGGS